MKLPRALTALWSSAFGTEVAERYSPHQLALRTGILVSGVGALLVMAAAGDAPPVVFLAGTAALAVAATARPDSVVGLLLIVAVAGQWAATVDDHRSPGALVAALLLLVFHTTSACASSAPPRGRFEPDALRRWALRLGVVAAITAIAWAAAMAIAASERTGYAVVMGAGLLVVAAFAWWLLANSVLPRRTERPSSDSTERSDRGVEQGHGDAG